MSLKMKKESDAIASFTRNTQKLQFELALGTARRHLDPLIELLEVYVEQTGGTHTTTILRGQLTELKRTVATRHNLKPLAKCGARTEGGAA
jgi:hypothetical protein